MTPCALRNRMRALPSVSRQTHCIGITLSTLMASINTSGCVTRTYNANVSDTPDALPGLSSHTLQVRPIGRLQVKKPAFVSIANINSGTEKTLLVSSFGKNGADALYAVSGLKKNLNQLEKVTPQQITNKVIWPNEARMAPTEALERETLVVAGGFLVPGRTGAISLIDFPFANPTAPVAITQPKHTGPYGWFYHTALWRDMNSDGKLDLVTARANVPLLTFPFTLPFELPWLPNKPAGELVWLEQPKAAPFQEAWKEHPIVAGPDVFFLMDDLDGDGSEEIIATEFFSKRLTLHWREGNSYRSRVIDDTLGSAFDLQLTDLNADGQKDLLVTNHEPDSKASVFAYEIPKMPKSAAIPWPRHTLLTGIKTTRKGKNQASPGSAQSFAPSLPWASKPWIAVSGDGAQSVFLLKPKSHDARDWNYAVSEPLADAFGPLPQESTIGALAIDDVDGDGFKEVFIPAYHADTIFVLTFGP